MTSAIHAVALRLHGPLQSWGGPVIGDNRPTLPFPTRSGVLGLVAACLGIRRANTQELLALADGTQVHIRVDAPGTPLVDDQTIQGNPNASPTRQTIQSKRTYLCDASFVAMIVPGPKTSTRAIAAAARRPTFAPFLGRRNCVLSSRLLIAEEVVAQDAIGLFRDIPPGPVELLEQLTALRFEKDPPSKSLDYYLDLPEYPGALRRVPIRDQLSGPLQRQWRERFVVHVRPQLEPVGSEQQKELL